MHGDAVVAVQGQGDREGDQVVYLQAEQPGYIGRTPQRLITLYDER